MRKTILLTFVLLISFGCEEDYSSGIYIKNESNDTIYHYCNLISYPDTVVKTFDICDLLVLEGYDETAPGAKSYALFETDFKLYNDTIMIYIYNKETLKTHTLQEIYENYLIAARYDLSFDDVRILNYRIPYPPTEDMSEMKIYIPNK